MNEQDQQALMEKRAAFLALLVEFSPGRRGAIGNLFFQAIAAGCSDPTLVCRWVYQHALDGSKNYYDEDEAHKWHTLMHVMATNRETALGMAEWALWWRTLPTKVKDRLKKPEHEQYRRDYMAGQPPTEKQIEFLRSLGHSGPVPETRLEASELIDYLLKHPKEVQRVES